MLYRIGEIAKQAGINKSVIDHYTRLGLLEPVKRSESKYRLYSHDALERISFIHKCQEKRFSLEEILHIIRGEASVEQAEVRLCMMSAAMSIDVVVSELKNVGNKLNESAFSGVDTFRGQVDILETKVAAASELLQMILQHLS